jgi:hypothetical protein
MPISRGTQATPSVGAQIHLKFKAFSGGDAYASEAADAVGLARIMIRQILSKVSGGPMNLTVNQLQVLDYYFVCGGTPISSGDFTVIRTTLQMTSNGLFGTGLNLKVTMAGDAMGYVNKHDSRFGISDKLRAKFGKSKSGWTPGVDIRDNNVRTHRGDIHLDSDRLDTGPELSAKTVIHEATHKFASTADFGTKGYTNDDDGLFRAAGLTHAEALNNAESYARFVMMAFLFP